MWSLLHYAGACLCLGPFFSTSISVHLDSDPALHISFAHLIPWPSALDYIVVWWCVLYINLINWYLAMYLYRNVLIEVANCPEGVFALHHKSIVSFLSLDLPKGSYSRRVFILWGRVNVSEIKECLFGQMVLNLRLPCESTWSSRGVELLLFKKKQKQPNKLKKKKRKTHNSPAKHSEKHPVHQCYQINVYFSPGILSPSLHCSWFM